MTQYTLGLTRLVGHGRAFSQVLPQTSPAAATGFTYTNDGRYWEILDLIAFRLVTDGNAANRQITLTIADGGGVALATLPAGSVQTASLTYDYTWSTNLSTVNTVVSNALTSTLPDIFLQPLFSVTVGIGSAQAGDQISNIRLYAQRFVTGPQGYMLGVVDRDSPEWEYMAETAAVLD